MKFDEMLKAAEIRGKSTHEIIRDMDKIASSLYRLTTQQLQELRRKLNGDIGHMKRVAPPLMLGQAQKVNLLIKDMISMRRHYSKPKLATKRELKSQLRVTQFERVSAAA